MPLIFDGLNEKGLAIGLFYFPTTAGFMRYNAGDARKTIAPWEMGSWILDNFASVEEVKANASKIVVAEVVFKDWGFVPPVHFVVHDASGKSIVIEYVGGMLNVHENPLGVMTNSPTFDWHMTNLRNYVNFSLTNVPPVQLGPVKLVPFGQGSGMLGLPGDFTPPSRFVRAGRVQPVVTAVKDRSRGGFAGIPRPEQLRPSQGRPPRRREGRSRQYPSRLHGLDERQRPKSETVLFPDLPEQPDSDGRSDKDEPRRQGYYKILDAGRRGYQVADPVIG